jgi:uncharacterized protein YecT (DUF1311 family)
MKPLFAVLLVFPLTFGAWLQPVRAQSQSEMNQEAAEDLAAADRRLNELYQKLLKENAKDPVFVSNLREAQRAWLKFVEFHLKTVFPVKRGQNPRDVYGSIYPLDYAVSKTALVEERIEQLKLLIGAPR